MDILALLSGYSATVLKEDGRHVFRFLVYMVGHSVHFITNGEIDNLQKNV